MLLLDASFLSALNREEETKQAGPAVALLRAQRGQRTVVSIISAGEYLEWLSDPEEGIDFLNRHSLVGLSMPIARRSALIQRRLHRRFGENDVWLAATAFHHDFTLVTADRDFDRVPRLKLLRF